MNRTWQHFSPFAESTHFVLAMLASGLDDVNPITIRASRRGLTMKIKGVTVAKGKDARALQKNFDDAVKASRSAAASP